jgi:hypothetical protein
MIELPMLITIAFAIILIFAIISVNKESFVSSPSVLDNRPILWFVIDDQPNTRKWADFSTRLSKQNNRGYSELFYKAAKHTQGKDFQVILLNGRDEVVKTIQKYGGTIPENPSLIPTSLWKTYSRAALLANAGGLYVDGDSVLFIGPSLKPFLQSSNALFGIHPSEPITSNSPDKSGPSPSPFIGYASTSKQSVWIEAESQIKELMKSGPSSYTSLVANRTDQKIMQSMVSNGVDVIREAESNRKYDGSHLNIYDLFARAPSDTPSDNNYLAISDKAAFVSFDSDLLERSTQLNFILKLSPQQIEESDLLFSRLIKKALNY